MAFLTHLVGVIFILSTLMLVAFPTPPPPPATLPCAGYRMAFFWPPGFCYALGEDCNKGLVIDDTFTAHGLWPCDANGESLQPLGKRPFYTIPKKLARELAFYWMNYNKGGDNKQIWEYEWNKHGERGQFSQEEYFKKGIELTKQYGRFLVEILKKQGIKPKDGVPYNVVDIETALFKGLNWVKPDVVCKKAKDAGFYVLSEIRLLLDIDAEHPRNSTSRICKQKSIHFPSTENLLFRNTEL